MIAAAPKNPTPVEIQLAQVHTALQLALLRRAESKRLTR